jgi:hypothetical protein
MCYAIIFEESAVPGWTDGRYSGQVPRWVDQTVYYSTFEVHINCIFCCTKCAHYFQLVDGVCNWQSNDGVKKRLLAGHSSDCLLSERPDSK